MAEEFKKGNLIFLKSLLVDLIYVIKCQQGEKVVAKKLDGPPAQWETLEIAKVVKLAEEQERLLPLDVATAIEKQRQVIFAPPKKKGGGKKMSMDKMLRSLPKEGIEEILAVLAEAGIREEEDDHPER